MNNISIFKMDTEIPEDIEDVQFFLQEELHNVSEELETATVPLNIVNFIPDGSEEADYSLIILGTYIIWFNIIDKRFDLLEIDLEDSSIYAYNLITNDTAMLESLGVTLSEITQVLNKALNVGKLNNYASNVPLNEFIYQFLGQYNVLSDISTEDVDDIILWLNGSGKKLH